MLYSLQYSSKCRSDYGVGLDRPDESYILLMRPSLKQYASNTEHQYFVI